MDLNDDGKIDEKDAKIAFDKVNIIWILYHFLGHSWLLSSQMTEVLGYQMPAGGGFTAGLVMGLRA